MAAKIKSTKAGGGAEGAGLGVGGVWLRGRMAVSHGSLHFFNYEQNSITVQPHASEGRRKWLNSSDNL